MSRCKLKVNKVSHVGRFLSIILIFPLWLLWFAFILMLTFFENIEKLTGWLFIETTNKIKEIFPLVGDDNE